LIVGGGPAAMEAARVAAIRGHKVVLYEKNSQLGGHLVEGTVPDFKADLLAYKDWLIEQMKKLGVTVELGKEVTARTVAEVKPDALVMATGSTVYRPDIPGIDRPIVTTAVDVFLGNADPGRRPIVAGGGAVGCELALYLAKLGKKVTIVEMLPALASELPTAAGPALVKLVQDSGVTAMTSTKISSITDKGVTAIVKGQDVVNIDGDKVILALGMVPQTALYEKLKGKAPEVFLIGDCVEAGRVGEATRDGYRVGNAL
ncbi:MAG: FAD-dependent oxidoreductase, partial [Dehalococcoidales bacterium]|nr:FAD-dependent oxidoreductase [Dehalococcoidales bacterium]